MPFLALKYSDYLLFGGFWLENKTLRDYVWLFLDIIDKCIQ